MKSRNINIHDLADRVTNLENEIHGRKTCDNSCTKVVPSPHLKGVDMTPPTLGVTVQDAERIQDAAQLQTNLSEAAE